MDENNTFFILNSHQTPNLTLGELLSSKRRQNKAKQTNKQTKTEIVLKFLSRVSILLFYSKKQI